MLRLQYWLSAVAIGVVCSLPAAAQTVSAGSTVPTVAKASLQPGDAVKLRIWREPDLSGEFQVDETGEVVFPKIGPVRVTGMATDSLKHLLIATYASVLRDPAIDITLLRRVTVSGFVRTPGLYQVDPTMTIADVLALAGGAAPDGESNKVELMRDGRSVTDKLSGYTQIGESPLRSGDQLYVPQRSWLSRNTGLVATVISTAGLIVATIVRN